jgi:hypothetical protein
MRRSKDEPDYEVFAPSKGTNHLLDPTRVSDGLLGAINPSLGTQVGDRMRRRLDGDLSVDKETKDSIALKPAFIASGASSPYGLGTSDGNSMMANRPIPLHRPQTKGGGPKSTLRTPKKMFSSFGRGVPFSGGLADFFRSASAGPAIGFGSKRHFIPNQGLFDMGINVGPKTLQGLSFNGAFPMFNHQQFNSSMAISPHDEEEEA